MSDGPHGVTVEWPDPGRHLPVEREQATGLPSGICLAATWDQELAVAYGRVLGAEARARGKDIVLGPSINIIRTPLGCRNFEYFSEDPHLTGAMAAACVRGIQSQGTAACIKHFICHNQHAGSANYDVIVDERTLREIYLPGFQAAVRDGGALAVMTADNKVRGQFCSHSHYLLSQVLKKEWGFDGIVVSGWGAVHDTFEGVNGGMDLEMTFKTLRRHAVMSQDYLAGLRDGRYSSVQLDDKVRRILSVMQRLGMLGGVRSKGEINTAEHHEVARATAVAGMVLLKNTEAVLPLDVGRLRRLAVIGDNATRLHSGGGGSSKLRPLYEVTPLQALRERFGAMVDIVYEPGYPDPDAIMDPIPQSNLQVEFQGKTHNGWLMECYQTIGGPWFDGPPLHSEIVADITQNTDALPSPNCVPGECIIQWRSNLEVDRSGEYQFFVAGFLYGLCIDGQPVCGTWALDAQPPASRSLWLEAGRRYAIQACTFPAGQEIETLIGWRTPGRAPYLPSTAHKRAIQAAQQADAVLYVGGLSHAQDAEGYWDLSSMDLPYGQDHLLHDIAAANPRTIVALYGGGGTAMPWLDQAAAVLQVWYPGMEGGHALVDILTGAQYPSGHLPISMPRSPSDCPAHGLGDYHVQRMVYREGIMVGYRWYDDRDVDVLFPFGFGLSYTRFAYADVTVELSATGDGCTVQVAVDITNIGSHAGAELVQVYVRDPACSVRRPIRELKGFHKIHLAAGQKERVLIELNRHAFAFYHPVEHEWMVEPGEFIIDLGSSSRHIHCSATITLDDCAMTSAP